jgi:hypothetical protein
MWEAPPLNQIMMVDLATLLRGVDEPREVGEPKSDELRLGETSPRALVLAASSVRRSIRDPAENGSGSMVAISSREVSEYPPNPNGKTGSSLSWNGRESILRENGDRDSFRSSSSAEILPLRPILVLIPFTG